MHRNNFNVGQKIYRCTCTPGTHIFLKYLLPWLTVEISPPKSPRTFSPRQNPPSCFPPAEIPPAVFHPPKSTRRFPPTVTAVFHPAEIHPCHFPPRTFSTRPKSTQHQNSTGIPMIRGFLSNHWNANWFGFEIYWLDDLIHDSVHFPYGTFLRLDQDKLG